MSKLTDLKEAIADVTDIVEPAEVDAYVNDDGVEVYLDADGKEVPVEDPDDELPDDVSVVDYLDYRDHPDRDDVVPVEEVQMKKVVRGGKVIRKMVCPAGYKLVDNKCVKMTSKEIRNRSVAMKKASRKMASKAGIIAKKRAKSMKIRGTQNL